MRKKKKQLLKKEAGIKFDAGKPRMSLLPSKPLWMMAEVMAHGELKYSAQNWRRGFKWSRLLDAAMRHINQYNEGKSNRKDKESNLNHLSHAAINLVFLMEHEYYNLGEDDLWKGHGKKDV